MPGVRVSTHYVTPRADSTRYVIFCFIQGMHAGQAFLALYLVLYRPAQPEPGGGVLRVLAYYTSKACPGLLTLPEIQRAYTLRYFGSELWVLISHHFCLTCTSALSILCESLRISVSLCVPNLINPASFER